MPQSELHEFDDPLLPPQVPRHDGYTQAGHKPPGLEISPPTQIVQELEIRPGDLGEDKPIQIPADRSPLTSEDHQAIGAEEQRLLLRELREAEELIASNPESVGLPSFVTHPLMTAVAVGSAGLLGLFLFNQIAQALALIGTLQGFWMYGGYAGLGLLSLTVLYACGRFLILYTRLQRNRQLRIRGLEELEKRTRLRWLVHAKVQDAQVQLLEYLRDFPMDDKRTRNRLATLGFSPDVIHELNNHREKLLDLNHWPGTDIWFTHFRDSFQTRLDAIAEERIRYWARRTALGTAISPNTLSDTLMTLYFSFTMLSDLCQIYNLRAGRLGTAILLARVFFNAYLAGQMQEMEHMTAEQIQNWIAPHVPTTELLLAKVLGKIGAKASAGAINYFLLIRLGRFSCRVLRPVSRE